MYSGGVKKKAEPDAPGIENGRLSIFFSGLVSNKAEMFSK